MSSDYDGLSSSKLLGLAAQVHAHLIKETETDAEVEVILHTIHLLLQVNAIPATEEGQ